MATFFNQFLNGKPTLHELCEHVRIDTKWYKFGVLLKVDITNLDGLEQLNKGCDIKALKMFESWLSINPKATRQQVIETLQKEAIGENTVAEKYIKALTECKYSNKLNHYA